MRYALSGGQPRCSICPQRVSRIEGPRVNFLSVACTRLSEDASIGAGWSRRGC